MQASSYQSRASLKERSIRSGVVTVLAQVMSHCLTVLSVAVLARVLTPDDYGTVAMVTAFTGFLNLFRDLGLSGATIQKSNITHDEVSALFFINVAIGAGITLVTMACGPVIAAFYGKPHLMHVAVGISFASVLSSFGSQHAALLNREMRFQALAAVQLSTLGAGFLAALIVALNDGGYWALVAQNVVGALWNSVALWTVSGFRPRWPPRGTNVRGLLRFGMGIAGFDVAYYFRDNVDKILLGRVWGAQQLGLYEKAFSLLLVPLASLRYPLNKVAFPAMSRIARDAALFRLYFTKYCAVLAFGAMPLVATMCALSDEIVTLLLGDRWLGAAELFRIFAVAGFIDTAGALRPTVMLASGSSRRLFTWGVMNAAVTVSAVVAGLPWGAKGMAIAYCVSAYLAFHPMLAYAIAGTPIQVGDFYRCAAKPFIASTAMLASYLVCIKPLLHVPNVVLLCIAVPASAVIYLAIYAVLPGGRRELLDYWGYVRLAASAVKQQNVLNQASRASFTQ